MKRELPRLRHENSLRKRLFAVTLPVIETINSRLRDYWPQPLLRNALLGRRSSRPSAVPAQIVSRAIPSARSGSCIELATDCSLARTAKLPLPFSTKP
jgi:hypothetical protein